MLQFWLVVTLSRIDFASLQYINTDGPVDNTYLDPLDPTLQYPLPYLNYFNAAPSDSHSTNIDNNEFYNHGYSDQNIQKRSTNENKQQPEAWYPNLVDTDKTTYMASNENTLTDPFVVQRLEGYSGTTDTNTTAKNTLKQMNKRSFSPWGGKRSGDQPKYEQSNMWTWKRTANIREPSMPKRVRFSPWGGKRSGQLVYKPNAAKGSKIIFSHTIPEIARIVSNYAPNGAHLNLAGVQLTDRDKRSPIRFLALSTKLEDNLRYSVPFHAYIESAKLFKPGHPYADLNLKKDGKRKVKFSAWGGKRSPPIIGPIWTPPSGNSKDNTLDAILLIRNGQSEALQFTKAL